MARSAAAALALAACAHAPFVPPASRMCSRACDEGFACVSGECLRKGTVPDVEALDKFGLYQARRLVIAPIEVARLAPGDTQGEVPRVATLGRDRDAASMLLLRFSIELPPQTTIVEAHIVLDRAPTVEADPAPIALHAARIVDAWGARSISWGHAPRLDDAPHPAPVTVIDDARGSVRLDVRALVRRWRLHAPDDQGLAIVADRTSVTGMAFAVADGGGAGDVRAPVLPVRTLKDLLPPPLFAGAAAEGGDGSADALVPRGPRLELYVRP